MKYKRSLILLIMILTLLTGCAPAAQDGAAYAPDESERLVLYTSHKKEVWWPIVKEFESRTGVWVEVVQGGTNELLERLQEEQDAPQADVMFGRQQHWRLSTSFRMSLSVSTSCGRLLITH